MLISRDPNNEMLDEGGSYIATMNTCSIYLDGDPVDVTEVIAADNERMFIDFMARDEQGYPMIKDGVLQLKRKKGHTVSFSCAEGCTDCARNKRVERQSKQWWLL